MGTRVNSSSINASSTGATAYTVALGVAVQTGDVIVIAGASQGTHAANGMAASMTATSEAFTTIKEQQGGNASSRWLQTFVYQATQAFLSTDTITFTPYAASTQNSFSVDIFRGWTFTVDQAVVGQSNASGTNTAPALGANATAGALVLTFIETATGTLTAGSPFSTGSTNTTTQGSGIGFVLGASGSSTYGSTWTLGTAGTNATETVSLQASATSIPWNPQRTITLTDPGESYWMQRDRRDANTVATAANPLVSPLDSAWQAGALYWHLYASAADNTARVWQPQQRARVSDPGLLATAELENELLGSADDLARHRHAGVYTERRLVPQQRPYVSDPLLLGTAELENELLGSFDDLARHRSPAAYTDRRLVPQQRPYVSDPRLLTSALLENELLGSFDDVARHRSAAVYTDRRLVPQQRAYVSDPLLLTTAQLEDALLGQADDRVRRYHVAAEMADRREVPQQRAYVSVVGLLDTAQLENELLGGADTGKRYLTPATHTPRWWMPQQPTRQTFYFDAGPDVPPLTIAWGAGGHYALLYTQAGWQPDRREVPQQRAYISDPSFYPTVAAADPLTVAWGVGGTYWHLYNTAADQVDRRLVPQQRRYISDPGLLSTALLGNELLGSADDLRRRAMAGAYWDRRQAGQQRPYFDPSLLATALLENELLGSTDDLRRRYQVAAEFVDRRQAGQQRIYFDPTLLASALLENELLGGATAALRYGLPATHTDRRQYPVQRLYQSDPLLLTTALLEGPLLGAADSISRHGMWFTDRRTGTQQPPRFDPSLLTPAGTAADPLLLAGAVGGDTWRRYHTPEHQRAAAWLRLPAFPGLPPSGLSRDVVLTYGPPGIGWLFHPGASVWVFTIEPGRWVTDDRPQPPLWVVAPLPPTWLIGGP